MFDPATVTVGDVVEFVESRHAAATYAEPRRMPALVTAIQVPFDPANKTTPILTLRHVSPHEGDIAADARLTFTQTSVPRCDDPNGPPADNRKIFPAHWRPLA